MPVLAAWVGLSLMVGVAAVFAWLDWSDTRHEKRQRDKAKRYEEMGRAKDAAYAEGFKAGRRDMGGYKTVTASDGWQFRIRDMGQSFRCGDVHVASYDEGADYVRFAVGGGRYRTHATMDTTIELVEIPKPEPERITACDGWEFRITTNNGCVWIRPEYTQWDDGTIDCNRGNCVYKASEVRSIELVEVTNAKSEPDPWIHEWEIDASAFCCDGRYETLHIDSDGHWETHRHSTGPKHRVVSAGQAKRVQ